MTQNIANSLGTMSEASTIRKELSRISANFRGLRTNVGDLTHNFVSKLKPDIVTTVETFLTKSVLQSFQKIKGYTSWRRKDRVGRTRQHRCYLHDIIRNAGVKCGNS